MVKPADLKTADGFKRSDKEGALTGFYPATSAGVSDFPLSDDSDISLAASPPELSTGDNIHRLVYEVTDRDGIFAIHAGWVPRKFHSCAK